MYKIIPIALVFVLALDGFVCDHLNAEEVLGEAVTLPVPQREGGMPLMQALNERRTSRSFSDKELPLETLSNLLWAAYGVNRPDGKRTAPSAHNAQEIDIYVAMESGLYFYRPKEHSLELILKQDIRALSGKQDFAKVAPVNLIFVADYSKMGNMGSEADFYAACDCGFVSQNVYLYCASKNLATVVRGWIDKGALAKAMQLRHDQKIILAQSVGFERKEEKK